MKLLTASFLLAALTSFATTQPITSWSFDDGQTNGVKGVAEFAPGVSGRCLVLDGLTTHLLHPAAPKLADRFTFSAWIALGSYPLNAAPIVDLLEPERGGVFFGVDIHGRPCLSVRAGERVQTLTATNAIPLRQWQHVAGVLTPGGELQLFTDGQLVASQKLEGKFVPPPATLDLLSGRARFIAKPSGAIRLEANAEIFASLDGALDELKIYDRALTGSEVVREFNSVLRPAESPVLPRVLPTGPPGAFGAFYTRLKFYPQWDNAWRVGDFPDVVVRFGELPIRFVFWRGTSYIPHWVTENGIWYNNEFCETWGDVKGCGEPMSDKQTRYSNVRVIESSPARCVVHWRYALADVFYDIARTDPATGWGDWADEVYTIYPDGTAVRDITLHSSQPAAPHEWHESIVVMGQGFSPMNSIEPTGLTLVDNAGERVDYSWEKATPPKRPGKPEHPVIQLVNTKSQFKPFAILRPQDAPTFDVFDGEIRRDVSIYPWWNHWPAATFASDGRYAVAADRVSHSSLSHLAWNYYQTGPEWMRKIMLVGLTEQPAEKLLPLARSWAKPAELKLTSEGFTSDGFDPAQKAYVVKCAKPGAKLSFTLAASAESPVVNPSFVLLGWGNREAKLTLDGQAVSQGEALRIGHRQTIDGEDLIVWLKTDATAPIKAVIEPR
jgi:hypothetical protein